MPQSSLVIIKGAKHYSVAYFDCITILNHRTAEPLLRAGLIRAS